MAARLPSHALRSLLAAQSPPVIEHTQHLTFAQSPEVHAFVFHPDGRHGIALLHLGVIDVWDVLVYYWPQVLAILAALLALPPLILLARVLRRPRVPGKRYCRKCNYDLTTKDDEAIPQRCPECGIDTARKRPVAGRALRRRLALPVALILLPWLAYAGLWVLGVSRVGGAARWLDWGSYRLAEHARVNNLPWLIKHASQGELLLEIDLRSGEVTREIGARPYRTYFGPTLHPDGRSIYLAASGGVARVSTDDARTIATFAPTTRLGFELDHPAVIAIVNNGRRAIVAGLADESGQTQVHAWDLGSGATRLLLEVPAYEGDWSRIIQAIPGSEGTRLLDSPNFMEAQPTGQYTMRVHDLQSGRTLTIPQPGPIDPSCVPEITADGSAAYLVSRLGRRIHAFDLHSGEPLDDVPPGSITLQEIALGPADRLIFLPVHPNTVHVGDLKTRRRLARLTHPTQVYALNPIPSPDGNWLAGLAQRNLPGGGFAHDLLLWDLRPIREALPPPADDPE